MHGLGNGNGGWDAVFFAVFILVFCTFFLLDQCHARRWKSRSRRSAGFAWSSEPDRDRARDLLAAKQVRSVGGALFRKKRLLSPAEYRVFRVVENELSSIGRGFRAFPQTNLGEILDTTDNEAFRSINSKRVDILVVDAGGWPALAIEYQGSGHYQGTAVARDTVKSMALRKAGVGYVEVFEGDGEKAIRIRLRAQLTKDPRDRSVAALSDQE